MDRVLARALSVTSVVFFATVSARLVAQDPRYVALVVLVLVGFFVPPWLARRRMRRMLMSGDVALVLGTWQRSLSRVTYPETMAPLMTATAYAAYGFIDRARRQLDRAARGPAWDAAVEQRLFVEALLDVYEGDRERAIAKATELERLPLPPAGFWIRRKVHRLRSGVAALARAFAHAGTADDLRALRSAARSSPLVHWAMRYAQAVIAIDAGRREDARLLIEGAPPWPEESAFAAFHSELVAASSASRG